MQLQYVLSQQEYIRICNILEQAETSSKRLQSELRTINTQHSNEVRNIEMRIGQVLKDLGWK